MQCSYSRKQLIEAASLREDDLQEVSRSGIYHLPADPSYNQTKANSEFQAAYPGAKLEGMESMRDMDEHREGRYYLRYHSAFGATEFWVAAV